jgi:hypothetical protein
VHRTLESAFDDGLEGIEEEVSKPLREFNSRKVK